MFAIEAMNAEKPVICYLRDDLVQLYVSSGLLNEGDLPIISSNPRELKSKLEMLISDAKFRRAVGKKVGYLLRDIIL